MYANALHPYPMYKPSGVPWLGDVPEHWSVRRLKQLCSESALYGANVAATQYQVEGIRFLRTTDIAEDGRLLGEGVFLPAELAEEYVLSDGDILLSRSGTVGRSFLYAADLHGPCAYAGYLVRFIPNAAILPKYLFFFTKAEAFNAFLRVMASSSTIENVNGKKYANMPIPLPPPSEQRAIVRYLDHVDARIRRYVTAWEKLIALLEEERQAVIHRAVTRGLDPNIPLKPSGVDWLGDLPAHWEVVQLGRIGRFSKGFGGTKDDEVAEGVPCIRYGDLYMSHKFFIRESRTYIAEEKVLQYTPIEYGDVLFAGSGETIEEIGKSAVNLIDSEAYCGGDVILFRPHIELDPRFSGYAIDCPQSQYQKSCMGRGITVMHIYANRLKYMWLGFPPVHEQTAIVEYLNKATADIDSAINRARHHIDLLREYRTRLIADVVTGKLDVREAAAQLGEQADGEDRIGQGIPMADNTDGSLYNSDESAGELAMEREVAP